MAACADAYFAFFHLARAAPAVDLVCGHPCGARAARKMTSCRFIARSTAVPSQSIGTSWGTDVSTTLRPKCGHFTCSWERTDHVLPTLRCAPVRSGVVDK